MGLKQLLLEKVHHRGQKIGDQRAQEHRLEGPDKLPTEGDGGPAAEQRVVKQQNGADREQHRQPHPYVAVSAAHGSSFSPAAAEAF